MKVFLVDVVDVEGYYVMSWVYPSMEVAKVDIVDYLLKNHTFYERTLTVEWAENRKDRAEALMGGYSISIIGIDIEEQNP